MSTPYSSDDLGRLFDAATLTRGRTLVLLGAVEVKLAGDVVSAAVEDRGVRRTTRAEPAIRGRRVVFDATCTCRNPACIHVAATLLGALDRFPALRATEQKSLFEKLGGTAPAERRLVIFDLEPGRAPDACFVTTSTVGERGGAPAATTPARIVGDPTHPATLVAVARLLGAGDASRTGVSTADVPELLPLLARSGRARWAATGKTLAAGEDRVFDGSAIPRLPPKSAILLGRTGPWYVDAATGNVGRVRVRAAIAAKAAPAKAERGRRQPLAVRTPVVEQAIIEHTPTPMLRLRKLHCPDDFGRLALLDALTVDFDYGGEITSGDDERQFVPSATKGGRSFIRRDPAAEASAFEMLKQDGFVTMRVADPAAPKGRRVFVYRGREAGEHWHRFVSDRLPALESLGFRSMIDRDFGPRPAQRVGAFDVRVADAMKGSFSLDFGIEIEGVRCPLLPILSHLHARGGIDNAQIVGDDLITSLADGRVVKLPAERIRRLLSIMGDLIEAAGRTGDATIVLPEAEAPTVLELEEVLATRWQNAAAIESYVARFRADPNIVPVVVPAAFKATLRPYQQQGVDWLQHLMAHRLGGFLADDMGLGKTAQTIAHIAVEHAAGRLDRPALIVLPTSLIPNWIAELGKFAPYLRSVVLHGMERHQKRENLDGYDVVITTYTVLARDIAMMKAMEWHIVVLDEAQAIKSPDAKTTRAVGLLQARQRVCLSGTPIENNLGELWSQFTFLMPGLLGDRRGFAKRFRTPIEKKGDDVRRMQLVSRIRPFILRRTKSEVATELPPKHTILRRITLAPDQRELYETIRLTMHEKVREQVAEMSLARSRIVVLDALLKLRQACCDPRLVKLASARTIETSSKLDDLLEMLGEMIPEGRRVLLFSQFTSMLDLIKPRLEAAGIAFVELRGDTRDRAEPVRAFQALEVPVFLISLKAGGRGLNLTAADTVIHYDPWWNPAVEDQASDRAHRIGQTKSVFVYKMIAEDTVEERILELQQRKAELANLAFDAEGDLARLEFDEIEFLFGDGDPQKKAA